MAEFSIKRRSSLLVGAWLLLAASIFSPGVRGPSLDYLHTPMWFIVFFAYAAASAGASRDPYLPIAFALPFFVLAPLLACVGRRSVMISVIRAIFCAGLVVSWTVPLACRYLVVWSSHWGCDELMWGYYLYCAAHTMAAFYIVMPERDPQETVAKEARGFPVITETGREMQTPDSDTPS